VSTTDSVWAFELAHNAAAVAARLGVPSVRFAPGAIPAPAREEPPAPPPAPTAEHEAEAAALAAPIDDERVRRSVQKAVLFSLARGAVNRPS
jgi:hypothetical protein